MKSTRVYKDYKSPPRKLLPFFERSRDQWKKKAQERKKTIKRLDNRMRFLEQSKDKWKQKAKELEAELARGEEEKKSSLNSTSTAFVV